MDAQDDLRFQWAHMLFVHIVGHLLIYPQVKQVRGSKYQNHLCDNVIRKTYNSILFQRFVVLSQKRTVVYLIGKCRHKKSILRLP